MTLLPDDHAPSHLRATRLFCSIVCGVSMSMWAATASTQTLQRPPGVLPGVAPDTPGARAARGLETVTPRIDTAWPVNPGWLQSRSGCPPITNMRLHMRGKSDFLHLLQGQTALVLEGPFLDRVSDLRIAGVVPTILHRGNAKEACPHRALSEETGLLVVTFTLPQTTSAVDSMLDTYGVVGTRSGLGRPAACAINPALCQRHRLDRLPVKLEPMPQLQTIVPDAVTTAGNGSLDRTVELRGTHLSNAVVHWSSPPPCTTPCVAVVSRSFNSMNLRLRLDASNALQPGQVLPTTLRIGVPMIRDGQIQDIFRQDTIEGHLQTYIAESSIDIVRGRPAPPPPPPPPPPRSGGGQPPNLLPQRLSTGALLRRINGPNGPVRLPDTFCAGIPLLQSRIVPVPPLVWGVSVVNGPASNVRVELRNLETNAVLSSFVSGQLEVNGTAETRQNYGGRPTQVEAFHLGDHVRADFPEYQGVPGCYLHGANALSLPLDPPVGRLGIVVDPADQIEEGGNGEADNTLAF